MKSKKRAPVVPGKSFGLAVNALIDDGRGRYLLLRRSLDSRHFAGQWEAPGGKVQPGESFDRALLREVFEETGLKIRFAGVAGVSEFTLPRVHVVLLCMRARALPGRIRVSSEHSEFAWVRGVELCRYDLTPPMLEIVRALTLDTVFILARRREGRLAPRRCRAHRKP